MSSNPSPEYIDPANVAMLGNVLRTAGFRGVDADASSADKHATSLFVNSEFQRGNRTRATLLQALEHRSKGRTNDMISGGLPKGGD